MLPGRYLFPMSDRTIDGYHAHVYYPDEAAKGEAKRIREEVSTRFETELGRWRDEPVGPHPVAMYQIKFSNETFAELVPWLQLHHRSLSVLIHPNTGDGLADHIEHALWLGRQLELNTAMFSSK
jgi:DOPA 4,5-dioxygenase